MPSITVPRLALALLAGSLLLCSPAAAATRYAAPGGTGPSASCPQADPCGIDAAVESAGDGDEAVLLPGDYTLTSRLQANSAVTVGPRSGMVKITSTDPDFNVGLFDPGAVLHDVLLDLPVKPSYRAIDVIAGTVDRAIVIARGTGTYAIGAQVRSSAARIRNSVIWSPTTGSVGVVAGRDTAYGSGGGRLINDTIVATDRGVFANGAYGVPQTTVVRNSIVTAAPDTDLRVEGGATVELEVDHSSYATATSTPGGGLSLGAGNLVGPPPPFADAFVGDFHVLAGAATIDAGLAQPLIGSEDLDRRDRIQDGGPDIGAYELPIPPETTITTGPGARTRNAGPVFGFASSEPGSTFACALDGAVLASCLSGLPVGLLADGDHRFEVAATDVDGNADPTPAGYDFEVDTRVRGAKVRAKKTQRPHGKHVKVKVKVGAGEAVDARATGSITVGKGDRKRFKLKKVTKRIGAGKAKVLRLKLKRHRDERRVRRALRAGRRIRSNPAVRLSDELGNKLVRKRVIRVK